MDRKLARRNLRTAYFAAIVGVLMFALTFVAALVYNHERHRRQRHGPSRRGGDPHAGPEHPPAGQRGGAGLAIVSVTFVCLVALFGFVFVWTTILGRRHAPRHRRSSRWITSQS